MSIEPWEIYPLEERLTEVSTLLADTTQSVGQMNELVNSQAETIVALTKENEDLKRQLEANYDTVIDGDVQAVLNAKTEGDTIKLPPDIYRLKAPLVPKKNQKLIFEGSTFKGSVVIGTWEQEGDVFVATVPSLPAGPYSDSGVCEIISGPEANSCRVLEDVFNGGKKLERVMQKSSLAPGKVYSDYATKKVYIMDIPDKPEISLTRFFMNSAVDGVKVLGAKIMHFASPSQQGALTIKGKGWEVDGCLFEANHSSGLHATVADRLHVHHNIFLENGQAGMTHHRTNDSTIEFNVFDGNNTNDYYRRDWESAGLKITYSNRVTVRGNTSKNNKGIGIWVDIDNKDIWITENVVQNNFSCGIRYEISFDGLISGNKIDGNGFGHAGPGRGSDYSAFATAAIHVNGAGGMGDGELVISQNIIGKNQNGIHLEERHRGASKTYPNVNWTTRNVKVLNNEVDISRASQGYGTGVVGLGVLNGTSGSVYDLGTGNEFEGNKYFTNNISEPQFHVRDTAINQYKNFQRWQGLGYDKTGSINLISS